jgi:hypothetical protein
MTPTNAAEFSRFWRECGAELQRRGEPPATQQEAWEAWRGQCPTGKEAATWIIEKRRLRSQAAPPSPTPEGQPSS